MTNILTMTDMNKFKAYIKANPMQLDVIMNEVYTGLTMGASGFVMFDGGAHKGWHTLRMLKLPGCAAVYGVEADPTMFGVVSENMGKWHTTDTPELHLIGKALQNDPATTQISWMSSHSHVGRSSIRAANADQPSIWTEHSNVSYRDETHVPATTIDLILARETRSLPFVKLDLEGADFLALQGGQMVLTHKRPVVGFENSDQALKVHGYTLGDIRAYFGSVNYVVLDYLGKPIEDPTWFDLYEAWTVPAERMEQVQMLIQNAVRARAAELG